MRKPIPLRLDHDAAGLRGLARASEDADQVRRLLALALIYDGGSRTQAAAAGGGTLQGVRGWVLRFNARGPGGLIDRKAPGQPSRLNDEQRAALAAMVENGPIPAVHGVIRWRIIHLCQWIWEEYKISVSKQTLSRELRAIGYRKLSARPRHHAQKAGAVEAFQKKWPATLAAIAHQRGVDAGDIEVWFGDEARIGQKNKITRRWAKHPGAARRQGTAGATAHRPPRPRHRTTPLPGASASAPHCCTRHRYCRDRCRGEPRSRPFPTGSPPVADHPRRQ